MTSALTGRKKTTDAACLERKFADSAWEYKVGGAFSFFFILRCFFDMQVAMLYMQWDIHKFMTFKTMGLGEITNEVIIDFFFFLVS